MKRFSMTECAPLKKPENKAKGAKTVEEPNLSTVNVSKGQKAIETSFTETHSTPKIDAARFQLYQSIHRAKSDIAAGRTVEAHTAINDIRARYKL